MCVCNRCIVLNLACLVVCLGFCCDGMLPENYILDREWLKNATLYRDLIETHAEVTNANSLTPEIRLHLITPNCDLWTADYRENPFKDTPYFAFYWAGGQGLSRYILDHPEIVRGLRVLDVGSGCGATAIAAALAGAKSVTANDIDPVACVAALMNAQINNVTVELLYKNIIKLKEDNWDCLFMGDKLTPFDEDQRNISEWLYIRCLSGSLIYIGFKL